LRTFAACSPCAVTPCAVSLAAFAASRAHRPSGLIAARAVSPAAPSHPLADWAIADAIRWSIRAISPSVSAHTASAAVEPARPGPCCTKA
jgi:hypothetical protein